MTDKSIQPLEVFYSYAHKDELLRKELEQHLTLLKRQGYLTGWHDRMIMPGIDWSREIDKHLASAHIILLLVSPDFMASDYCYDIEVKRALERHETGEARVIPIILRPVEWEDAPFGKLQVLPQSKKPVVLWHGRGGKDRAFHEIAKNIREIVKQGVSVASPPPPSSVLQKTKRDWLDEGNSHYAARRYHDALAAYRQAIQLEPHGSQDSNAFCNAGIVLFALKQYDQALISFDRAIYLNHDDAKLHFNRGIALANLQEFQEALEAFDTALLIDPTYMDAHEQKTLLLRDLENKRISFDLISETYNKAGNFSDSAKKALLYAYEEAISLNHNYIGTEHILLGLLRVKGIIRTILHSFGIELFKMRDAIRHILGEGNSPIIHAIALTPRAKRVIALAVSEALRFGNHDIAVEYLFLGLVREGDGIGAGMLKQYGITLEIARNHVMRELNQSKLLPSHDITTIDEIIGFSDEVLEALFYAEEEAKRLDNNYISTPHILLGLLRQPEGNATLILSSFEVELETIRTTTEGFIQVNHKRTDLGAGRVITPEAKSVLQIAYDEASSWESIEVGTEYILLGIAREAKGNAAIALICLGISSEDIMREIVENF